MRARAYLHRRSKRLISFRCRVPTGLVATVGRGEIVRTLRTDQTALARFLAAGIALRIATLWSLIPAMKTQNEVNRLIEVWFRRELDHAWRQYRSGSLTEDLVSDIEDPADRKRQADWYATQEADNQLDTLKVEFLAGDYSRGHVAAREVNRDLDVPLNEQTHKFALVARETMIGAGKIATAKSVWAEGDLAYEPTWSPDLPKALFPDPEISPNLPNLEATNLPLSGKKLSLVFENYAQEKQIKPKTRKDFATSVRRFIDIHGDLDVALITKRHLVAFKDMMLRLPADMSDAMRRMPAPDAAALSDLDRSIRRISPHTVNNKGLGALSAVLGYACRNDLISGTNPAKNVKAMERRDNGEPKRLPYTMADLAALFASPVFTKGARPVAGAGEAAVWLPILALFTGARLEELGRLTVGDVLVEDGVQYLFIREGKTASSRRKVPIHSRLKLLGFLSYVEQQGPAQTARLFPQVNSSAEEVTKPWSQWWGRYARRVITPDPLKVFHSFRHSAKREFNNAGCPDRLSQAVMGHEGSNVPEKYGRDAEGRSYNLSYLAEAMEKLTYAGLTITLGPSSPGPA